MLGEALAPLLVAAGLLIAVATASPGRGAIARAAFAAIVIGTVLRYLWWRWTDTLLDEWTLQGTYTWACFIFEIVVSADLILGMITLSRTRDRRAQADEGEAWARAQPTANLPSVDVLIPTYNEERDVLERTIVGAASLDYPRLTVWVLDDGRRSWVAELAASKGARYLSRSDNRHAKAGNINAALGRTTGDLILVLDADFVPRSHLLWRTVGFFRDPRIACVQTPQYFFNKDPTQTNLGIGDRWADDQRMFFDVILPCRDAWGAAFCCGTGFVMRRSAIEAIGGGIPTDSICEDMLTSIELKRRGLETVYLKEELCIGLAPESVKAFFVQRQRWARGQVQILFLKHGLFGRKLPMLYRLMFLPSYWLIQLPARIAYIVIPIIFLLSGLAPLYVTNLGALIGHLGPALIGSMGLMWWLARSCYFPILTDASSLFLALRVAPNTLLSLVKPFGVPFSVTPKGASARGSAADNFIVYLCLALIIATVVGLAANGLNDWRVVRDRGTLAFATFWALVNCLVLGVTAMIAREGPRLRIHERFSLHIPARLLAGEEPTSCRIANLSLGGAYVRFGNHPVPPLGSKILLAIAEVGQVAGIVVHRQGDGAGLRFVDLSPAAETAINKLRGAQAIAGQGPRRAALRIRLDATARFLAEENAAECAITDASLTGALLIFPGTVPVGVGERATLEVPDLGLLGVRVARASKTSLGVAFEDIAEDTRDALIRLLYTVPRPVTISNAPRAGKLFPAIARRLFGADLGSLRS